MILYDDRNSKKLVLDVYCNIMKVDSYIIIIYTHIAKSVRYNS